MVVAGVASGVGKTAIATGLMAALRGRGIAVAGAKVGPDFIDPGYHALACGRPARNLDPWLCGPDVVPALAARAAAGADVLVIEGVMGLFDGAADGSPSSTADVARLLDAPVVLVVDAAGMAASVAAVVRGFRDHDPRLRLAGVICNRVGSDSHETLLREAVGTIGVPVLGCVRRDDALAWRDRHLGLIPASEEPHAVRRSLARLAARIDCDVDLDAFVRVARAAPPGRTGDVPLPPRVGGCRIALAGGRAFTFAYTDTVEALEAAGAEIVPMDPLHDPRLPAGVDGLVVGGGFPELFGEQLAANQPLLADTRARIAAGLPTWAECGGLLWLAEALDGHRMVGAVPTRATLGGRLHLGYRVARTRVASPLGPPETELRGHEFHYSTCEPSGDALALTGRGGRRAGGFATPTLLASYLHHHAGGDPAAVTTFVRTVVRSRCPSSP